MAADPGHWSDGETMFKCTAVSEALHPHYGALAGDRGGRLASLLLWI